METTQTNWTVCSSCGSVVADDIAHAEWHLRTNTGGELNAHQ